MRKACTSLGIIGVVVTLLALGCTESRRPQPNAPMMMSMSAGSGGSAPPAAGSLKPPLAGCAGSCSNGGSGGTMMTKPMMMPPQTISDAGSFEGRDGNFKPPLEPRDAAVPDSSRPDAGQCTDGTQRCVLPNGGAGICTESGTCGGCQDNNECIRVYGAPYYLCATGENCFIPA